MTTKNILLAGGGLAAIAAAATLTASAWATPTGARNPATRAAHVQKLAVTIRPSVQRGVELVSPENIALAPGVPVRVTVTNLTREFHTFTVPGLHVSRLIFPAGRRTPRKTTFTFTAREGGSFVWYCLFCRNDGSEHRRQMGGTVYVIIDPSVVP